MGRGPRTATGPGPDFKARGRPLSLGLEARGRPLSLGRTSRPEDGHCPWALAKKKKKRKKKKKVASRPEDGHCPWAGFQGPRPATVPGPWKKKKKKKKKGGLEARGRPLSRGRISRPEASHCP